MCTFQAHTKKLFSEITKCTLCFPSFNNDSKLSFPFIKEQYSITDWIDSTLIDDTDIISHSFSKSKIEEVYTQIRMKYNIDYRTKEFKKTNPLYH